MTKFISYIFIIMGIVFAVPIAGYIFTEAGYTDTIGGLPNPFGDFSAPNLDTYATYTNTPIDPLIGFAMMGINMIVWVGQVIVTTMAMLPVVLTYFGVPSIISVPISAFVFISGVFFIFFMWRGYDLDN